MKKLIPFKCNNGHTIIEGCSIPYPTRVICYKCLEEIKSGGSINLGNSHIFKKDDIKAYRW